MTDPTRGARSRRGGRRPGWLLLTVLLVLAIVASSALVFTNRVELLKLAVILALWAAVVAAFVSVIYRRQSDMDQAKVRDLKLVYDLQLDREISARREYELSVETQLRRELSSELRAQAADEVAGLRAELAALRANLEILFDADLSHRPALETERSAVRAYSDWARDADTTGPGDQQPDRHRGSRGLPHRHGPPHRGKPDHRRARRTPSARARVGSARGGYGGAHRRPSEAEPQVWPSVGRGDAAARVVAADRSRRPLEPTPTPRPAPEPQSPWPPPQQQPPPPKPPPPPPRPEPVAAADATVDASGSRLLPKGQWIPAGAPGSNWASPIVENGSSGEYVGRRRAPEPAMQSRPAEPPPRPPLRTAGGRRPWSTAVAADLGRRTRGSAAAPRTPATAGTAAATAPDVPRHRSADETETTGGQSVAELLARLQAAPTGGGRRRRRDE